MWTADEWSGYTVRNKKELPNRQRANCDWAAARSLQEKKLVDSPHVSGPLHVHGDFAISARNITETLGNLAYLIRVDAHDPSRVQEYARQAEERVRALGELLRTATFTSGEAA